MATKTEALTVGDIVLDEQPMEFCRLETTLTLAANASAVAGLVVETDGAGSGDYKDVATDANASGILLYGVSNSTGSEIAAPCVILYKGPAIVNKSQFSGHTVLATVVTALEALGIRCRAEAS
jgi:hypothetical protein